MVPALHPKQTKTKVFIKTLSSIFVSFSQPPDYLYLLLLLSALVLLLLRVRAPSVSVRVAPDLGFMPVSVVWVWSLDTAGERERERGGERDRGRGHYIMFTLFSRWLDIMKAGRKNKSVSPGASFNSLNQQGWGLPAHILLSVDWHLACMNVNVQSRATTEWLCHWGVMGTVWWQAHGRHCTVKC